MYELKNHTEIDVYQTLQVYLRNARLACKCERCQADIMALALNQLPVRYYVTLKGEILTQWEGQTPTEQTRILAAVVRAAEKVGYSPSHTINDSNHD